MQTKSLQQLRRALSAALFVLLLSLVGMKNALAQNQVATLQHNETITQVFYGPDAFISAHNAAVNGDIITLSSGTFNNCTILEKAITINGAGCVYDTLTQVMPTIIPGTLNLYCNNISFEGIWFSGEIQINNNSICFKKCNINTLKNLGDYGRNGIQIMNCIINWCYSNNFVGTTIINSFVRYMGYSHSNAYLPNSIYNSVIIFNVNLPITNIMAYNSIILTLSGHTVSNCAFYNCIEIKGGDTSYLFEGQIAQNVMEVDNWEDVFEHFHGEVTFDNVYQLKEEIATSFLGNDGTEVGIYGGMMPYRTRPNYMIVKNCNVAGRTTEDNKLSVEIELLNEGE